MNRILNQISDKLLKPMEKISSQRHLVAIRDGILAVFPLTMVGSLFWLITILPFPETWFIKNLIDANKNLILKPYQLTTLLTTLYMVVGVGANLAKSYGYNQVSSSIVSLVTFLMTLSPVTPATFVSNDFIKEATEQGLLMDWYDRLLGLDIVLPMAPLSGTGAYIGVFSSIVAVETMRVYQIHLAKKREEKKNKNVPDVMPASVVDTINSILPIFFIVFAMFIIRDILQVDLHIIIISSFSTIIKATNNIVGAIIFALYMSLVSFFGLSSFKVSGSAARMQWNKILFENQTARRLGLPMPNVAPLPFYQFFIWIGGVGSTLSLTILMCFSKSRYLKNLGKTSILLAVFNINDPILYGTPVLLNPYLFIPYLLAPVVTTIFTYVVIWAGLVGKIHVGASTNFPIPLSAYLSTGDYKAVVLCIVNIIIAGVIYYPFLKIYEAKLIQEGEERARQHALKKNQELSVFDM